MVIRNIIAGTGKQMFEQSEWHIFIELVTFSCYFSCWGHEFCREFCEHCARSSLWFILYCQRNQVGESERVCRCAEKVEWLIPRITPWILCQYGKNSFTDLFFNLSNLFQEVQSMEIVCLNWSSWIFVKVYQFLLRLFNYLVILPRF